ncbi:MAG: DUF1579 family protein [Planctomycetaceae bacterium]|nr:DUF1579 family protein [Planctomycetaceae bacterium]MCA9029597.1 DUF1579 family protein [Planctomycetaceae bacterium]MCA9043419.1 DUF1579 family protein [Planctomycetaceae bacterium]
MRAILFTLCCLMFAGEASGLLAGESPAVGKHSPNVSELAVLERFAGSWEGHLVNSDQVIASQRVWVLDGRFLKHDFNFGSGSLTGTIYRGYDTKNSRYTLMWIDSQGTASLLAGYWSEEQKTLTFEAVDSSCRIAKFESYFPDAMTEQWLIIGQGDEAFELRGVTVKQK